MDIHHIGIATDDLPTLRDRYESLLNAPVVHEERFDGMLVSFLALGNGYFELLEPTDDGPIARYLSRRGSGIHHVAVATGDLEGALAAAREAGVTLVDEEPRAGAWGHDVAFLHPKSTGGTLIEFVRVD